MVLLEFVRMRPGFRNRPRRLQAGRLMLPRRRLGGEPEPLILILPTGHPVSAAKNLGEGRILPPA